MFLMRYNIYSTQMIIPRIMTYCLSVVCGSEWVYYQGNCYLPVMEKFDMNTAKAACATHSAIMAAGKTDAEMNFIHSLWYVHLYIV